MSGWRNGLGRGAQGWTRTHPRPPTPPPSCRTAATPCDRDRRGCRGGGEVTSAVLAVRRGAVAEDRRGLRLRRCRARAFCSTAATLQDRGRGCGGGWEGRLAFAISPPEPRRDLLRLRSGRARGVDPDDVSLPSPTIRSTTATLRDRGPGCRGGWEILAGANSPTAKRHGRNEKASKGRGQTNA